MDSDSNAEVRQIIFACLAGEQAGMMRLIERFRAQVFGLCFRMLGQWQDAEDAVQDTFLRVSRSLHGWDVNRDFEPWLLAIAANCCRSQLKRRQRRPDRLPLAVQDPIAVSEIEVGSSQLLAEEVERALRQVPTEWANAFRLFHSEGLSYRAISVRLDRPEGTIKTWVHRTRKELVRILRKREILAHMTIDRDDTNRRGGGQ